LAAWAAVADEGCAAAACASVAWRGGAAVACAVDGGGCFAAKSLKATPRPPLGGLAVSLAGCGLRDDRHHWIIAQNIYNL
jgi:hypothetical protein